jgi:hypothetical protein
MRSHAERGSEFEVGHYARVCAPVETVGASNCWLEKEDQRPTIICSLHASRLQDIGGRKLRRLELLR